jgi:hypothetical protein
LARPRLRFARNALGRDQRGATSLGHR